MAVALLLLLLPIGAGSANAAAATASGTHVYLLRGVLNIFSLGMDQIAAGAGHQCHRGQLPLVGVARG